MLFKLKLIIISLLVAAGLGIFTWQADYYFYVLEFLIGLHLLLVWPFIKRLRFVAMPFFLSSGALNLLYLVDGETKRILFIVLATIVYYLALLGAYRLRHYDCDLTAQGMINLATIVTVFFWFVSNYGWYLNFDIDSWVLVVVFIVSTFLITFPSLAICFVSCYKIRYRRRKWGRYITRQELISALTEQIKVERIALFFSSILALIMGEIIWGLSQWPFGYLVTGTASVLFFFLFWIIIRRFIQGRLTRKFVVVNISLVFILVILMLVTSPWTLR